MTTFELDQAALDHLLRDPGGPTDDYIAGLAHLTVSEAKGRAPVATGKLRDMIRAYREGGVWYVIADTDYSLAVHEGTRPHVIRRKPPGKVLRFPSRGGTIVYAPKVDHPGTAGQPFLTDALRSVIR